jgi:hypothetical protein
MRLSEPPPPPPNPVQVARETEERLKALGEFKQKAEAVKWLVNGLIVGTIALGVIAIVCVGIWHVATLIVQVARHEREIAVLHSDLRTSREKFDSDLRASRDKLDDRVARVDDRLREWEVRGFRPVQAFFQEAEVVSLQGDRLTLTYSEEGGPPMTRTFTVDAEAVITREGKPLDPKSLKLEPKAVVQFMLGDKGQVVALQVDSKR